MRTIVFEGDSLEHIRQMPEVARQKAGYELDRVQRDKEPTNWKPFSSIGQGVREIRIQMGMQFRLLYVVKFQNQVHVLHAFEKKTQKTRQTDIDIAKRRLQDVIERYKS